MDFLLLFWIGSASALVLPEEESVNGESWLRHYGYVAPLDSTDSSSRYLSVQDLSEPIREMQRFYNLEVTGLLDQQTITAMKRPRCGVPDKTSEGLRSYEAVGTKWDKYNLTYSVESFAPKIAWQATLKAIRKALQLWESNSPFVFEEIPYEAIYNRQRDDADIMISFDSGPHKGHPEFKTSELAHASVPPRPGVVHFNSALQWSVTNQDVKGFYDVFLVAVHELGHSLGLDHSKDTSSIMHPIYQWMDTDDFQLPVDDRLGIQHIYGYDQKPNCDALMIEKNTLRQEKTQITTNYNTLLKEKDQLTTNYNTLLKEKDQITTNYDTVLKEKDQITTNYNTLLEEKDQITTNYNTLLKEKDQITTNYDTVLKEKYQITTNYNTLLKEKDQITTNYNTLMREKNTLTREKNQLTTDYHTLMSEKEQLAIDNDNLTLNTTQLESEVNQLKRAVSPPTDLTVVKVTSESVDLSWANERTVTEYLITYVPTALGGLELDMRVPGDQKLATIQGLKPDIEYLINVYAVLNKKSVPVSVRVKTLKSCPGGWKTFGDRCYYQTTELKTWQEGRAYCQSQGADLVSINSPEEQVFIRGIGGYWSWMGLTRSGGRWTWLDGTPLTTTYWSSGSPRNDGDRNCAFYYHVTDPGTWANYPCSYTLRAICEK